MKDHTPVYYFIEVRDRGKLSSQVILLAIKLAAIRLPSSWLPLRSISQSHLFILYVHCSLCRPKTNRNKGQPFELSRAVPVDLFPHTDHCELIMLMERMNNDPEKTVITPQQNGEQIEQTDDDKTQQDNKPLNGNCMSTDILDNDCQIKEEK